MLAQLPARRQVPAGAVEVVALEEQLAHADVEVGHPPHDRRHVLARPAQALLVGAHRVMEAPLRDAEVGQSDGAGDLICVVAGPLQAGHALGVPAVGGVEVAVRPVRQPEERGSCAPLENVLLADELEHPAGVGHRAGHVAVQPGQRGPVHGDGARQHAELRFVHDHHRRRFGLRCVEPPLGRAQELFHAGEVAGGHARSHQAGGQHRPPLEDLGRERLEPAAQGGLLARLAHGGDGQLDEVRGPLEVVGRHGVADRFRSLAVQLEPVGGPPVERPDVLGSLLRQPRSQHVTEEVVVAVPVPAVVERYEEQVRLLERLQHGLPAVLAGQRVAQCAGQSGEDRGLQQEIPDLLGLSLQDLSDQVVDDVAVVAGEPGDELGRVVATLHRQRRQLQGGDPPLGSPVERDHVLGCQVEPHHPVEVGGGLLRREAEVGGADLDQLAPGP
ncbi:MAG TPA: hypothetical protein VM388_08570 [Acidimicrobiales bacterium]|nr:hypothetical protein [Acidimicrobiales bacterium]